MKNDMNLNIRISSQLAKVGLQPIMDLVTCSVKKKTMSMFPNRNISQSSYCEERMFSLEKYRSSKC